MELNMWKSTEINDNASYRLLLIQEENGYRRFVLKISNEETFIAKNSFLTECIDNELLKKRNLRKISEKFRLIDGSRFYVDAHGIWLTESEMNAITDDKEDDEIPWLNGMPPNFASK